MSYPLIVLLMLMALLFGGFYLISLGNPVGVLLVIIALVLLILLVNL